MKPLTRNHADASGEKFDLIIIGAGIYGIALAYMASSLGLKNLLIEKNDFGWATSFNSLRTIHGGLRYLQKLDLPRFFESVSERRWFLKEFPGLVSPLPCLMPLYGNGAYKPSVFKAALTLNDILSRNRNRGVAAGQELLDGKVIGKDEVIRLFPSVDQDSLKGGAIWYDGGMPASQLVVMEMLKRACCQGTTAFNYTSADKLIVHGGKVDGVSCTDLVSGRHHIFRSPKVINAAGPWARSLAADFDRDLPDLFHYSIAWNVLLNKKALSTHSVAVKPKKPGARMYFIHAKDGLVMAGTVHSPREKVEEVPLPTEQELAEFIDDLNLAIPGFNLSRQDILHIYSGLLPARESGTALLATREVIIDHGAAHGPRGFYSLSGVKFTTAKKVAEKVLTQVFPGYKPGRIAALSGKAAPAQSPQEKGLFAFDWRPDPHDQRWKKILKHIIETEMVVHLDDLLIRRTTIGDNPKRALEVAPAIVELLPLDQDGRQRELERLEHFFASRLPRQ